MITFDKFSQSAIAAQPILTDGEIELLLKTNNLLPLYRFLYRIACFTVGDIRAKAHIKRQDEDYIDAVQECASQSVALLQKYDTMRFKLSTYAHKSFVRIALRYLAIQDCMGMHSDVRDLDDVPNPLYLQDEFNSDPDESDNAESWEDYVTYAHTPQGYSDPMMVLIRQETVRAAIRYAADRQATKAESNRLRAEINEKIENNPL